MELLNIPLDLIDLSDLNVRKDLRAGTEDATQDDLVESIRDKGLLQPVVIRPVGERYEPVAGQRRVRACRTLGWSDIPAFVEDLSDDDAVVVSLTENFQRADMSPIDKADAFGRLRKVLGSDQEVAKQVHLSVPTVRRYSVLENLADSIRERVTTAEGSEGVGVLSELAKHFDQADQEEALDAVDGLKNGLKSKVLKESEGSLDAIPEIRERVMEESLSVKICKEDLCRLLERPVLERVRDVALRLSGTGSEMTPERFGEMFGRSLG